MVQHWNNTGEPYRVEDANPNEKSFVLYPRNDPRSAYSLHYVQSREHINN